MQNLSAHESARAIALEAASRIVADTDDSQYRTFDSTNNQATRDKRRTQATVTMAQEFARFIIYGDAEV